MTITVIYGTGRREKSSTYQIAQQFIGRLSGGDPVAEFFLPRDMPHFCRGCWQCFTDHTKCPDHDYLQPIIQAMEASDLLIITAPVYVYHVPGQVKALLDHFGYRWMPHQPGAAMFHKQALLISTAAGAGTRSTLKDMKDSMVYWGVARTHTYRKNVRAADWDGVSEKIRQDIGREVEAKANTIKARAQGVTPSWKVKGLFYVMRAMQKKFGFNPADVAYWRDKGWLEGARPWK